VLEWVLEKGQPIRASSRLMPTLHLFLSAPRVWTRSRPVTISLRRTNYGACHASSSFLRRLIGVAR
jgi:hypothetical protein